MPSSSRKQRIPPSRNRGFTLLEVLVVMVLMAILSAAAITTINYAMRDDDPETEARRIAALVALAIEEALLTGREYGLRIDNDSLQFFIFDDMTGQWQPLDDDDTFHPRPVPESIDIDLVLEGQAIVLRAQDMEADESADEAAADEENATLPQLMFLSSGQITPFTLTVSEDDGARWTVSGDLLGRLELESAQP